MGERYQIETKDAGQGGFGRIDKAWDNELERYVAIKTLDPLFKNFPSPEDKERFQREAKILARLTHPNIPAIYDVHFPNDQSEFRLFFQWIDGLTIRQYLQDKGIITIDQVRHWFSNLCSALQHAHNNRIIHRDIKPSNIIITPDLFSCYLVDFGISLNKNDLKRVTGGSPLGTPGYMSPEQEKGEELYPSSDLFSLAIVLYECLCGIKPTIGSYTALNSINEAIPSTIDDLIRRCLLEHDKRIQTASDFYDLLKSALKPKGNFSTVLSQGSLADIHVSLTKMTPDEYSNLPLGQRKLIVSRIKDMIRVDSMPMRNPIASLLSELVKLSYFSADPDFEFIIVNSFHFGYEIEYSEKWKGNISIRDSLNKIALICSASAHNTITKSIIAFWPDIEKIKEKESWYHHDLRILLQNILANDHCSEDNVSAIASKLDQLNQLTH